MALAATSPAERKPSVLAEAIIPTADGDFVAQYSAKGLCALRFPALSASGSPPASTGGRTITTPPPGSGLSLAEFKGWLAQTEKALKEVLSGESASSLPPLDLSEGTEFQQRVWRAMLRIAPGEPWSYGKLAREIGIPKAVRAVGAACGANPLPVLVPCHRVVASGGKLGGFSSDPRWKKRLLGREPAGMMK